MKRNKTRNIRKSNRKQPDRAGLDGIRKKRPLLRVVIILVLALVLSVLPGCKVKQTNPEVGNFFKEYTALKGEPLKVEELEALLVKYDGLIPPGQHEAELLKSRILLRLSRYKEAINRLDRLSASKPVPEILQKALLAKVEGLLYTDETQKALTLFKTIEPSVKPGEELYTAWLYFALYAPEESVRSNYADKFLKTSGLSKTLLSKKARVYRALALNAIEKSDIARAGSFYSKAISEAVPEAEKSILRFGISSA